MAIPVAAAVARMLSAAANAVRGMVSFALRGGRGKGGFFTAKSKMDWHGDRVFRHIKSGMDDRAKMAAEYLRDRVVANISKPVGRTVGPAGGSRVVRSRRGEFPRAESFRLARSIRVRRRRKGSYQVGTALDYGLILETRLNRSFLRRTFMEERPALRRILLSGTRLPGQDA